MLRALEDDNSQERNHSRLNRNDTGLNDQSNNKNDHSKGLRGSGHGNKKRNDNNEDHLDAICPIHGGHTVRECTLIRNERQRYQESRGNNETNNDRVRNNNNCGRRKCRYNTRKSTHRNEYNNNINETHGNETEDELSAMNNIYEEMNTFQQKETKKQSNPILSEIHIKLASSKKMFFGLLGSGATDIHTKRSVLSMTKFTIAGAQAATVNHKSLKPLPDFSKSRSISVTANIDDNAIGRHDNRVQP